MGKKESRGAVVVFMVIGGGEVNGVVLSGIDGLPTIMVSNGGRFYG